MNYRRSCTVKNGMIDGMFIFLYRMFSFKEILKKDFFLPPKINGIFGPIEL